MSRNRAVLIVLDSVGCGGAPDAARFGDEGANTLLHIATACAEGRADREGLRQGPLAIPTLAKLGLGLACRDATGAIPPGLKTSDAAALFGCAREVSLGKDTPSGHWEIAGTPVPFAFGYFPETVPAFPAALTEAMIRGAELPGLLGNCHASGVEIIERLGAEHVATGKPIVYTSVDSVLQIAAHETHFGLDRLYRLCMLTRRLVDDLMIGRVIARPFSGEAATGFHRTAGRKDFSMPPPPGTLLQMAEEAGRDVVSLGKIGDIFAHRFTGREVRAAGNKALFEALLAEWSALPPGGFAFANLVDFDTEFGHRRDVAGYAACLEAFDRQLPALLSRLTQGDLLVITADHGNDPTWHGTDHTREQVPVLAFRPGHPGGPIGARSCYADIGQSVAAHLALPPLPTGTAFLERSA